MTLALTGHAVARGIVIGRTHLSVRNELEIGEFRIAWELPSPTASAARHD